MELEPFVDDIVRQLTRKERPTGVLRKPELRGSQLPICEVYFIAGTLLGGFEAKESYMGDFYMNVGTVLHMNAQKWLGRMGILYGDWECPKCRKVVKGKLGTQYCSRCKLEMRYKELEYKGDGVVLHFDGILHIPIGNRTYVFLLEVKTTSVERYENLVAPYATHYAQSTTYSWVGREKLGLPIDGSVVLYLQRNLHTRYKFFLEPRVFPDSYNAMLSSFASCVERMKTGNFKGKLHRTCEGLEDGLRCPTSSICFHSNKATRMHLNQLWKDCGGKFTIAKHTKIIDPFAGDYE